MNTNPQTKQFCQSCSMPMEKLEDFGTNADGTKNQDYCAHCFQKGSFTDPTITMEQMIEKCSNIMKGMNLPQELIEQTQKVIPTLKRWK